MPSLDPRQLESGDIADRFARDGYVFPVDVLVLLAPGQASFHHGKLLHGSGPNRSDGRRVGFAINYISTRVRQMVAKKDFAMLVRGADRDGHFQLVPPPNADLSEEAMAWHRHILTAQNEALYDGAHSGSPALRRPSSQGSRSSGFLK